MYRKPSPNVDEFKSIAFRCFTTPWGPAPANSSIGGIYDTRTFPAGPCPYGLRINNFFPTCWDGVNLDSPDHKSHVAYPSKGTFETEWECPSRYAAVPSLTHFVSSSIASSSVIQCPTDMELQLQCRAFLTCILLATP